MNKKPPRLDQRDVLADYYESDKTVISSGNLNGYFMIAYGTRANLRLFDLGLTTAYFW